MKTLCQFGADEPDIDDVFQDVILAALQSLHRFDEERSGSGSPDTRIASIHLRSWLFGIAWRQISHFWDKAHRRREVVTGLEVSAPFPPADPSQEADAQLVTAQRAWIVDEILERMDPDRRVILVRHDLMDETVIEIARDLGVNQHTAQNRLRLGRQDFQAAVKRLPPEKQQALRVGDRPFAFEMQPIRRRPKPPKPARG